MRELGHSGDELPEWECGERCEESDITWAATTSERATMQAVGVAMLGAACGQAVTVSDRTFQVGLTFQIGHFSSAGHFSS